MDREYRYGAEIDFRGVELKSKGVDRLAELAGSDPFSGGSKGGSAGVQTSTKNAGSSNNTNPVTTTTTTATSKTGSSATDSSPQTAANSKSTATTTASQQAAPTVQSKSSSSAASQQNTPSQPKTTPAQSSTPSPPSPPSPPSSPSPSSPPPSSALVLPSSYSIATTPSDLVGIWYPHSTSLPSLSSYPPSAFLPYQIIINPTRIMISGGCNTIFTSYTFNKGTLTNLKPISTKKQCPVDRDSVLTDILLSTNVYHIGKSSNAKIIQVKSKQGAVLLQLIDRPPQ